MSKTITIIQLIHLVANDDKKPYQVKYEGNIYTWDCLNHYVDRKDGTSLFCSCVKDYKDFLNDTVEIIEDEEDEQEIDIQEINLDFARLSQFSVKNSKGQEEILEVLFVEIQEKMKELARKINYLDKNIKEKQ